jgi:Cys-tRNA(Pro)/Cys-tRNA(Cys) deacylase
MDNELPPAARELETRHIPHQVFHHSQPVNSVEEAAGQRGQRPEQVVRSIVFRLEQDEYLMALVTGGRQISWKSLRHYLGRSRLTMASEDEVLQVTGYRIGAVSPFGLPQPMRILVDQSVLDEEEVSLGSGVRGVAIVMKSKDLLQALSTAEVGAFAADQPPYSSST